MGEWTGEDRAAARAFLQRCEVRLSTLHRVATALLSGAGLMVLLPAMLKDHVVEVLRVLLTSEHSLPHILLSVTAALVLVLPFVVLFLLLGDLTRFYFHAQHLAGASGQAFAPRFTLTGLRLPSDELSPTSAAELAAARLEPLTVELLVPSNPATRAAIDAKLDAYGGLGRHLHDDDIGRADGLFELVAARSRTLAEEVAKVEHGMARHLLRLQVIVMRYVKALLAFLTTAIAVAAALSVVRADPGLGGDRRVGAGHDLRSVGARDRLRRQFTGSVGRQPASFRGRHHLVGRRGPRVQRDRAHHHRRVDARLDDGGRFARRHGHHSGHPDGPQHTRVRRGAAVRRVACRGGATIGCGYAPPTVSSTGAGSLMRGVAAKPAARAGM